MIFFFFSRYKYNRKRHRVAVFVQNVWSVPWFKFCLQPHRIVNHRKTLKRVTQQIKYIDNLTSILNRTVCHGMKRMKCTGFFVVVVVSFFFLCVCVFLFFFTRQDWVSGWSRLHQRSLRRSLGLNSVSLKAPAILKSASWRPPAVLKPASWRTPLGLKSASWREVGGVWCDGGTGRR